MKQMRTYENDFRYFHIWIPSLILLVNYTAASEISVKFQEKLWNSKIRRGF